MTMMRLLMNGDPHSLRLINSYQIQAPRFKKKKEKDKGPKKKAEKIVLQPDLPRKVHEMKTAQTSKDKSVSWSSSRKGVLTYLGASANGQSLSAKDDSAKLLSNYLAFK
ncbi:MAG: hypothetical protein EXX96DRAFT_609925 [Benjaminiella poitrasii]|nr:MAG: hypothetical protein EXX96DRAFT_609925 [Benjaminiella poitrasii]